MAHSLANLESFFEEQFGLWPQAASNFAALKDVEVKQFNVDGMPVKIQFNPARIVSSAAKVDKTSLQARKCFLCDENRPECQIGIEWGDRYIVLVNPFPIFPRHLTIPDKSHTLQLIEDRIADMIRLAHDLKGYTVFYNGPKCGASAPDHMHFQAGNSDFLPIWETVEKAKMDVLADDGKSVLMAVHSLPLKMFVIDAYSPKEGAELFKTLYAAIPVPDGETEPMMNILCRSKGESARIIVIPRKRHRPSFYGTEGDDCMLLSPASVDMGGVFITPRRKDFDRIDEDIIRKVFNELCLSENDLTAISNDIKKI